MLYINYLINGVGVEISGYFLEKMELDPHICTKIKNIKSKNYKSIQKCKRCKNMKKIYKYDYTKF